MIRPIPVLSVLAVLAVFLVLPVLSQAAQAPASGGATTIVLVRHGERLTDDPRDPGLSPAGEARAQALADALQGAQVSAVYATELKRTQATAEPVAKRFQLGVQVSPSGRPAGELAQEILRRHAGETVVVVGHSNTIPGIVQALSGQPAGTIQDHEFHHLFVVVVPPAGPARVIQARYGQPTPQN